MLCVNAPLPDYWFWISRIASFSSGFFTPQAHWLGEVIGQRTFVLTLANGETVLADERFFALRAPETTLSSSGWTPNEKNVLKGHHWWSRRELDQTTEIIFPERLLELLTTAMSGHLP